MTDHWPADTFDWFDQLEANNNRDWFEAKREPHERIVAEWEPAGQVVEWLAELVGPSSSRPAGSP